MLFDKVNLKFILNHQIDAFTLINLNYFLSILILIYIYFH